MSQKRGFRIAAISIALTVFALTALFLVQSQVFAEDAGAASEDLARYYIQLQDQPVALYTGNVAGYAPTSPSITGDTKLDANSPASVAYENYLETKQNDFLADLGSVLGRSPQTVYQFQHAVNGVVLVLTPAEADAIANLPEVVMVEKDTRQELATDVGPEWIGADTIWDGSATGIGTQGEGVIVGIMDTGINMDHPSFADIGGDGYDHTNPFGSGNYVGWCDPANPNYDPKYVCNDKLIGGWDYTDPVDGPEDSNGHGSHTASTVAGNVVTATLYAPTSAITDTISGVAPHANIIAYDVCDSSCPTSDTVAAVNQAIMDGVDVINESISIGGDAWNGSKQQAYLGAVAAGIFYSRSAGNAGPAPGTVGPEPPWTLSVAAMTHNRKLTTSLIDMTGGDTTPPADMVGAGFTAGYGPAPIVYAGDYPSGLTSTPELCGVGAIGDFTSPWPPGTFNGEIVVCDRGTFGRVEKGANVLESGAGGYILANTDAQGEAIVADPHELPGVHIGDALGDVLRAWLASGSGHMATIEGVMADYSATNGDVMAGFSSRGPSVVDGLLKPDVSAPGVSVWAAVATTDPMDPPEYGFLSGTSMASPHAAGSAALLKSLYPSWTPAQIMSALMTSSTTANTLKEDGVTPTDPFDVGAGRISLYHAANAGLVLDVSAGEFTAADPGSGGDPTTLNLASMNNADCGSTCTWTRTVQSTSPFTTTWDASVSGAMSVTFDITPMSFTLGPNGTQMITVTADMSGADIDFWYFGEVLLENTSVNSAYLKVAHLAPFAMDPGTAVTVTLDGNPVLTDFAYGDSTQYIPVTPGDYDVEIFAGSSATPAITGSVSLMEGMYYSAIATGDGTNQGLSLMALADDNTMPMSGNFKLRLGHLAPFDSGNATADVRLQDGTPVITNVNFSDVAPYIELPAGSYDLKITSPGGGTTLIDPEPATFNDGDVLSAFAVGDGSNQPLGVFAWPSTPDSEGFMLPLTPAPPVYYAYMPIIFNGSGTSVQPTATAASGYNVVAAPMVMHLAPDAKMPIAVRNNPTPPQIDIDPTSFDLIQLPNITATLPLTISNVGGQDLDWSFFDLWAENFDSYANGQDLHGVNGWKGWANDPAASALVSNAFARSAPNSVDIAGASDLVREYAGYTSGKWTYTAWQYIPSGFTGQSFFILLNSYDDAGATNNWSVQVNFDATSGQVVNDGVSGGTATLITDQWVEIRVDIDLDNNTQDFYYDGTLLYSGTWTEENSGGGALNIGAVDLFANGASSVYYDDLSLAEDTTLAADLPLYEPSYAPEDIVTPAGDGTNTFSTGNTAVSAAQPTAPEKNLPEGGEDIVTITHSASQNIVQGSIHCGSSGLHADNSYIRRFTLGNFGITGDFNVMSVDIGIESATAGSGGQQPAEVRLYTWDTATPFEFANFTLIGQAATNIADQTLSIVNVPVTGTVPAGGTLVVEFFTPNGQTAGHGMFVGSNADGQTDASFLAAPACGAVEPTDIASLGFPNMHLVMNVTGDAQAAACDGLSQLSWVDVMPTSGTTASGADSMVSVTFDSSGLMAGDYSGNLCINSNDPMAPTTVLPVEITVPSTDPRLQVAHLAPFAMDPNTAVTVTLNSTAVLTDFAYGDSTPYLTVAPGQYLVEVFPGSSSTPAMTATVDLMAGTDYTVLATGDGVNQNLALLPLVDDQTPPASGNFKLRLGHLAPFASGNATADIRLQDGTPVLTDVNYLDVAPYIELPAGTYDLKITDPGGAVTLIDPAPVTLGDGDIVSAFATGDGSNQPLGAFALPAGAPGAFLGLADAPLTCNGPTTMFEGMLPTYAGWSVNTITTTNSVEWGTTNDGICASDATPSGNFAGTGEAACIDSDAAGGVVDSYLCSPALDLSGQTTVTLDFLVNYQVFSTPGADDLFEVVVGTSATGPYDPAIFAVTDDYPDSASFAVPGSGSAESLDLSAYAGQTVYVCFHYSGNYDWYAHVDDVSLSCTP